jgi:hypothetical protein
MPLPSDEPDQILRWHCIFLLKNPDLFLAQFKGYQGDGIPEIPFFIRLMKRYIEMVPRKAPNAEMVARLVDEELERDSKRPMAEIYRFVGRLTGKTQDAVRKDYERLRPRRDN